MDTSVNRANSTRIPVTSTSHIRRSSASEALSLGLESASLWIRFVPFSTADEDPRDRCMVKTVVTVNKDKMRKKSSKAKLLCI